MGPADLARAIAIAAAAHCEQIDKSGKPYILHPIRVLQRCSGESFETQIVAALHDVVEDTWVTLDLLREMSFSQVVIAGVDAMTHREGESYFDYIERCSRDPVGTVVKLADLADNSDPVRAYPGRERALARYARATEILRKAARDH